MLPSSLPLFILLISSFFLSLDSLSDSVSKSPSDSPNPPTVYDTLHQSGLPSGLLPDSVISYSLSSDGSFVVELEKACYIQFEYLVYYERRITGTIHYGSITDLKGIQVKGFLFWFNVYEIKVDLPPSDYIYFEVGWITKKVDVTQFSKVRSCGDGISSWKYLLKQSTQLLSLPIDFPLPSDRFGDQNRLRGAIRRCCSPFRSIWRPKIVSEGPSDAAALPSDRFGDPKLSQRGHPMLLLSLPIHLETQNRLREAIRRCRRCFSPHPSMLWSKVSCQAQTDLIVRRKQVPEPEREMAMLVTE